MNRADLLDSFARSKEDRLLLARVLDKAEAAARKNIPAHTHFLSSREAQLAEAMLSKWDGCPNHTCFGGYDGAERAVLFFLPDYMEADDLRQDDAPIAILKTGLPPGASLSHRDFLGALLGMGITREAVGDILPDEDGCTIFLLREVRSFLLESMESVGRVKVHWSQIGFDELKIAPPQVRLIRDTFATPRLDAVAASGFSVSRSRASDLITGGRVSLNHLICIKPDKLVEPGDVVSARGFGKFKVQETGGLSKKGRVFLVLERYI